MMELKFRAFDTMRKFVTPIDWVPSSWVEQVQPLRFHPVMQFVGVKDKNGKDIYEGDIIEMRKKKSKSDTPFFVGQVKNKGWLGFEIETDDDYMDFEAPNMIYEVIGNIYENPELLPE